MESVRAREEENFMTKLYDKVKTRSLRKQPVKTNSQTREHIIEEMERLQRR